MSENKLSKSDRHSKILGDFGESFVMYWLSKRNYEPILVDYTGIDIIAYNKSQERRIGISVKSRTRKADTEEDTINVSAKQIPLILKACRYFNCDPYFGCVIDKDEEEKIGIFIIPFQDVLSLNNFKTDDKRLYIRFSDEYVKKYERTAYSYVINMNYKELRNQM